MQYYTIKIDIDINNDWKASYYLDKVDRVDVDYGPNSLGFYHCPTTKDVIMGFKELKQSMIKRHEDEIKRLQASLKALMEVQLKEN